MKVNVLDTKGNNIKEITLDDSVYNIEPNKEVLGQYLRVYLSNQRQGTSDTKTRSDVRGGGRKPWRQKGTGRARHGSIRSPIWVGGGITHGPHPKSWRKSLPRKLKQLAMRSALSQRMLDKDIVVVDKIEARSIKTGEIKKSLEKIITARKNLIVLKTKDENLLIATNNLRNLSISCSDNVNVYEILDADKIILLEDAALYLQEKYKK